MENSRNTKIFNAIKKDDLNLFSSLFAGNKELCFGRFPILSLCYLYKANKIIRKYEKTLLSVSNYNIVNEPFEIYQKFKVVATRCLRLYLLDQIVEPIEMLAILGRDFKVKKLFKINRLKNKQVKQLESVKKEEKVSSNIKQKKNNIKNKKVRVNFEIRESSIKNLNDIYLIKNQSFCDKGGKVKITKKPLSFYQKNLHKMAMIVSSCFVVVLGAFYLLSALVSGIGTTSKPFFVYNQNQLFMALKAGGNYELKSDINISSSTTNSLNFDGLLNGNNHTIYVTTFFEESFIDKNLGTIKNLNIVYASVSGEVSKSVSLLCKTNSGEIDNVNIKGEELNLTCNKLDEDILISAFSNENTGTIDNCNLELNANFKTKGDGECNFAGFANLNSGSVTNCNLKTSTIQALDCDVSGIVSTNNFSGNVANCKNYANLEQESIIEKWSSNVSGIVLINYGVIKNCYNFGKLQVNSLATLEDDNRSVFLGGICAMNCREIDTCLNKGDLLVNSKKRIVYLGGISGRASYCINEDEQKIYYPSINNCGVDSKISIETEGEKTYAFSGGISGFLYCYAEVKNCYSLAEFNSGSSKERAEGNKRYFTGSFLGALQPYIVWWGGIPIQQQLRITASNNFVLNNEGGIYQVGALLSELGISNCEEDILDESVVNHTTKEKILQAEVYWNE